MKHEKCSQKRVGICNCLVLCSQTAFVMCDNKWLELGLTGSFWWYIFFSTVQDDLIIDQENSEWSDYSRDKVTSCSRGLDIILTDLFFQGFQVEISIGEINCCRRAEYSNTWNPSRLSNTETSLIIWQSRETSFYSWLSVSPLCAFLYPHRALYLEYFPEQSMSAWEKK